MAVIKLFNAFSIDYHPPKINRIRRVFIGMLTTIISRIIKVCEIPCNTGFEQDNITSVYLNETDLY